VRDGRIATVGAAVDAPADAIAIDGTGRVLTPGLIDVHSHLGVYASPGVEAHADGNEMPDPATPQVWAEHSVWPQDPQFPRNLEGGVTTVQVLPGSGNLIGGRSVVLKVVSARTVQEMKFPGAKYGLKMACGENPKRVYQQRGPSTRMGNVAGYRDEWIKAERYRRAWDAWLADPKGEAPERDLAMETLAEVLRGNILVQNHCYRADEMAQMIDVAREFGYRIRSFHHGVEAYKIADLLAKEGISASVWADWGGFKMESLDAVRANAALVHAAGGRAVIHSDSPIDSQRLNQEAAKALAAGRAAGLPLTEEDALGWITANAAWTLGLEDRVGTIEPGKNADLVLWSGTPFSVYAHAERVWIDGALRFDRSVPSSRWRTDFELGFVLAGGR
jgi:imidazolonepropionase-like amidohydrolase